MDDKAERQDSESLLRQLRDAAADSSKRAAQVIKEREEQDAIREAELATQPLTIGNPNVVVVGERAFELRE